MSLSPKSRRSGALAALLFVTSLLSCGREVTGPGGARFTGSLALAPHFDAPTPFDAADVENVAALVPYTKVRVLVLRAGEVISSKLVAFGAAADTVAVDMSVPLLSRDGDSLQVILRYINAAGDTLFSGGPFDVVVFPGSSANPTAVEMPVLYVGPGADALTISVTPDSVLAISGQSVPLTAVARNAQEAVVNNAVIGFISRDPARVVIPSLGVGSATVVGARGTTYVVAQLVGGAKDSTKIVIDPRPTTISIEGGNGQSALNGAAFAQPLRVRVRASDNLGVANWPVNFAVTTGAGTLDSTLVYTDSLGFAQVIWTAGAPIGAASVTASLAAPAVNVVFTGTQQSTGPTSMTFATQPNSITAGNAIDTVRVEVRNGAGNIITSFNGSVEVALVNGTVGAQLIGTAVVSAANGIAKFGGLTVDRQGNNYRLAATTAGVGATFTNPFNVAPAPAAQIAVFSGGGQSGTASTALADSIVIKATDQFGFPVAGVTVNVAVTQGGGSVSPTSGITSAGGFVPVQWTLGATGPQQLTATAGALPPLVINATLFGGGGPTVLFAGYDYTYVPAGQPKTIPVFLSSPSASPITVNLATQLPAIVAFDVDSVVFAPGVTRLDVPLTAGDAGISYVHFTSSAGDDSVYVFVDSASVNFADLDWDMFTLGDTVRATVILSDPAPAGGVSVRVRSMSPEIAQVAVSDGEGVPVPACLSPSYCGGGDLRADTPAEAPVDDVKLLGPLGDSTDVFIPEGQRVGYVAAVIVALGGDGGQSIFFNTSAAGFIGDVGSMYIDSLAISVQSVVASTFTPVGIGQNHRLYAYYPGGAVVREHRLSLSSSNPAVATVDSSAVIERFESFTPEIGVRGISQGSTYIRFGFPGGPIDSVQVTVGTPRLIASLSSVLGEGEASYMQVISAGPDGSVFPRSSPLNFTVVSRDTSVVQVVGADGTIRAGDNTHSVPVRMVGPGSAWVVAMADAHDADSVLVSSTQEPLAFYFGSPQVGVGQYEELTFRLPSGFYLYGETKQATITSTNPSIVQILTPTQQVGFEDSFITVIYEGVSPGNDTVRVTVPGHPDFDFEVTVVPAVLAMTTPFTSIDPDSVEFTAEGFVSDGFFAHPMMDSVYAKLRSSDPSVVQVTDSIVTIAAGAETAVGKFRGLQPGSAYLKLAADPYGESDSILVTVLPYQLSISTASSLIGIRTQEFAAFARNSPASAILNYTITQSGPGAVSFVTLPDSFPAGETVLNFSIAGVTAGEDTLTFSAPGHAPTTLIVTVDSLSLDLGDIYTEVVAGFRDEFVYGYLRIGESSLPRRANEHLKFVVRSLDTLLAKVEQDTVIFEQDDVYPTQFATVRYKDYGTAQLVVEDPLGIIAPDTIDVTIDPRELFGYTSYGDGQFVIGMGQKSDIYEVSVERGYFSSEPLWVHLKASAEGVITIPDSVLIGPGMYDAQIPIIAGDTVGSVRVEASVPGYNPWQFDVTVTRTVAEPWFDNTYVGGQNLAEIYLVDALTLFPRAMASPVPLRFTTTMPGLLNTEIGTFLTDTAEYYTVVKGPIGLAVGSTTVTVEDARVASFDQIASGSASIDIYQPTVELLRDIYSVGLGLTSISPGVSFNADAARDSIWVRLATSSARAKAAPDSVLLLRNLFMAPEVLMPSSTFNETFTLTGDSLGFDTLTISADGFTSDYAILTVEPGILVLSNAPAPTVVMGDSTFVTLALRDPSGGLAMAADVLQLTFSTDTNFVVSDGTTAVTTMNIPASATTVSFWIKATNSGSTELTVTSPNFRPFKLRFSTRPIAG
jgi:hypothetical protein